MKDARGARRLGVIEGVLIGIVRGELFNGVRQGENRVVLPIDVVALDKHRASVAGILNDDPSAVAMDRESQLKEEGCKHCQECEAAAHVKSGHSMNTRAIFCKKKM